MVKIRLARVGTTNQPKFRIVVAEKTRATQGKFLEVIGNFDKSVKPPLFSIEKERYDFWLKNGAQPSETIHRLVNKKD